MVTFSDIGLVWLILAVFCFFVVVSQIAWWSGHRYFPNQGFAGVFHRLIHLSSRELADIAEIRGKKGPDEAQEAQAAMEQRFLHKKALALMSAVPAELEISGFFATLFWPLVIILNLFLLAQVLPVAVGGAGGAGVFEIHPFGVYGALPMLAAVLYSFTQTAFGIMFGEAVDKKKKYFFLVLLVLSVLAEGGLSIYRAWLIQGGGDKPGATLVDTTLGGKFGLLLGGFFGIVIPISHSALGYIAYPKFVRPILQYALRFTGGLALFAWTVVCFLLFAWHPTHPDDWREIPRHELAHWDTQQRLLPVAATLESDLKLIHDLPVAPSSGDLSTGAPPRKTAEDKERELIEKARNLRTHWLEISEAANERLKDAQIPDPSLLGEMKNLDPRPTLDGLFSLVGTYKRLVEAIAEFDRADMKLRQYDKDLAKEFVQTLETRRAHLDSLQGTLDALQGRTGGLGMDREGILAGLGIRLAGLLNTFSAIPVPAPGDFRFKDYLKLAESVEYCKESHAQLGKRWSTTGPLIPDRDELNARQAELKKMPDLTKAYQEVSKCLYEAKQTANERLKRVERRPGWVYWLADHFA